MGAPTAAVSRDMFAEEKRFVQTIVQENIPWIDADENDRSQIGFHIHRRLLEKVIGDVFMSTAFKIVGTGAANDFTIKGGDGSVDGMARAFVSGHPLSLIADRTYKGATNLECTPKWTQTPTYASGPDETTYYDSAANFTGQGIGAGDVLVPDVTVPGTTRAVTAVTQTTLKVAGNHVADASVYDHYRFQMVTPSGSGRTDEVYLDIFLDEIGADEDSSLYHNLGGNIEAQRRLQVIQSVLVVMGGTTPADYTDTDGNKHYTYKLATITRFDSVDAIAAIDVADNRQAMTTLIVDAIAAGGFDKLKCSSDDTTPDYLEGKLTAGTNVVLTTLSPGGDESVEISVPVASDEKVKISANDTTASYLNGKLIAGSGVILTEMNDGGDEDLKISAGSSEILYASIYKVLYPATITEGIQEAIDALPSSGGVIILPSGDFAITGKVTVDHERIILRGQGSTHINAKITTATEAIEIAANHVLLEGFQIDSDKDDEVVETTTALIRATSRNNLVLRELRFNKAPAGASSSAINLITCDHCQIRYIRSTNSRSYDIRIAGGSHISIDKSDCTEWGLSALGSIYFVTSTSEPSNCSVRGCHIYNSAVAGAHGITFSCAGERNLVLGCSVYSDGGRGISLGNCKYSIAALNNIKISPSTATSNWGVHSGGAHNTIHGNTIENIIDDAIEVDGNWNIISENHIYNVAPNTLNGGAIHANGVGTLVLGNHLEKLKTNAKPAIAVSKSHCRVIGNKIYDWNDVALASGILCNLSGTSAAIEGNILNGISGNGITVLGDSEVVGNRVESVVVVGISLDANCTCVGNTLAYGSNDGIVVGSYCTVNGNVLRNNTENGKHGIAMYGIVNSVVVGNVVHDYSGANSDAIHLDGPTDCLVSQNNTSGSGRDGLNVSNASTNNTFDSNHCRGDGITQGAGAGNQWTDNRS